MVMEKQELQNQLNARIILENSQGLEALQKEMDGLEAKVVSDFSAVRTENREMITDWSSRLE